MPSALLGRVQVLEAGHVAAHDDEVHALGVLDVEVAHGPAAAVDDRGRRARSARPAARCVRASSSVRPFVADGEAADGLRRHRRRRAPSAAGPCRRRRPRRLAGVDVDAAAGERRRRRRRGPARRRSRRAWRAALMPPPRRSRPRRSRRRRPRRRRPLPWTRTSLVARSTSTDVTPATAVTSSVTATLQCSQVMPATT